MTIELSSPFSLQHNKKLKQNQNQNKRRQQQQSCRQLLCFSKAKTKEGDIKLCCHRVLHCTKQKTKKVMATLRES
jgi:spore germination protein GerM